MKKRNGENLRLLAANGGTMELGASLNETVTSRVYLAPRLSGPFLRGSFLDGQLTVMKC